MPDHNGAMTNGELGELVREQRDRIAVLKNDVRVLTHREVLCKKKIETLEARIELVLQLYHANYPGFIPCALKGEPIPQNILDVTDRIIKQELGGDDD